MSTKYLCIDENNILKSNNRYYTFEFDPESTGYSIDTNSKLILVGCKNLTYEEMNNSYIYKCDRNSIQLSGKYKFHDRIKINGVYYYIKSTCTKTERFIFSVFICGDVSDITRVSNDLGEYYLVPNGCSFDDYVSYVNRNSDSIYIEYTGDLADMDYRVVANIYGIDLFSTKPEHIVQDTTAFNVEKRIYLDEISQVAELIRTVSKSYPEIQLYTDPNNRDNYKKVNEFLYYRSQLFDDDSPYSSTLFYNDPVYGKVMRQAITIQFRYETYDINDYINRRNEYLINKFLNEVSFIHPKVSGETLQIGVNWMRDIQEREPEKVQDASDRFVYSFSFRAIVNGLLLEKFEEPTRIDEVIACIYPSNKILSMDDFQFKLSGQSNITVEGTYESSSK